MGISFIIFFPYLKVTNTFVLLFCSWVMLILNACIVVSLRMNICNFYVCLLYRPPSEQQVLDTLFSALCIRNSNVFSNFHLVGDFNIDVSNHNHPLFSKLLCITSSFLLYQVVKNFTHFNQSGNHSIIDLAFVSPPFLLNFCNTITPLSILLITMASFFHFILILYPRDLPPAHAERYGAMLKLTLIWLVNY